MTPSSTADQHFGHQNIIGYCARPFHGIGEMNAVLVANWNAVVGPHDTVHVLGDVALGRREESMPLVGRLAGHRISTRGTTTDAGTDTGNEPSAWSRSTSTPGSTRFVRDRLR